MPTHNLTGSVTDLFDTGANMVKRNVKAFYAKPLRLTAIALLVAGAWQQFILDDEQSATLLDIISIVWLTFAINKVIS